MRLPCHGTTRLLQKTRAWCIIHHEPYGLKCCRVVSPTLSRFLCRSGFSFGAALSKECHEIIDVPRRPEFCPDGPASPQLSKPSPFSLPTTSSFFFWTYTTQLFHITIQAVENPYPLHRWMTTLCPLIFICITCDLYLRQQLLAILHLIYLKL